MGFFLSKCSLEGISVTSSVILKEFCIEKLFNRKRNKRD